MLRRDIHLGQTLVLDGPKAGRVLVQVTKINPKNIKLVTETGTTWNAHSSYLTLPAAGEVFTMSKSTGIGATMGAIVRFTDPSMPTDLLVVVAVRGAGYSLAKLGGDSGRYYSGISAARFDIVSFELAGV